tara:strand:- start:4111 stop:4215 length:105 start_codon:yes stop_codon:yes gene_type:complete
MTKPEINLESFEPKFETACSHKYTVTLAANHETT